MLALLLSAALSPGPIQVTECSTEPVRHAHSVEQRAVVSFVNTAQVAAIQVSFQLSSSDDAKVVQRFTDRGTFSPNVPIKQHKFDTSLLSDPVEHPVCSVLEAKFADGSTWLPSPQP